MAGKNKSKHKRGRSIISRPRSITNVSHAPEKPGGSGELPPSPQGPEDGKQKEDQVKIFGNKNKELPGAGDAVPSDGVPPPPVNDQLPGRQENEQDPPAAGITTDPPAPEIPPAADPPEPPQAKQPPAAPPAPPGSASGKYRVKDSAIMFNGRLYREGSVISLTAKDAGSLKKFLEKI